MTGRSRLDSQTNASLVCAAPRQRDPRGPRNFLYQLGIVNGGTALSRPPPLSPSPRLRGAAGTQAPGGGPLNLGGAQGVHGVALRDGAGAQHHGRQDDERLSRHTPRSPALHCSAEGLALDAAVYSRISVVLLALHFEQRAPLRVLQASQAGDSGPAPGQQLSAAAAGGGRGTSGLRWRRVSKAARGTTCSSQACPQVAVAVRGVPIRKSFCPRMDPGGYSNSLHHRHRTPSCHLNISRVPPAVMPSHHSCPLLLVADSLWWPILTAAG